MNVKEMKMTWESEKEEEEDDEKDYVMNQLKE